MKKTIAVGAVALVAGAAGGALLSPAKVVEVPVEVPVNVTEFINNTVEVPVEVVKNVTVEVPVDNGNLDSVLDHIYDNNGNIEYIVEDLDDDELDKIVDRVVFVNEAKKLAVDAIEADLFDELDGEVFDEVEFDEDDMERLRIDDDADEISVNDVDFEDRDIELTVTGSFEQDDVKYDYEALVKLKDGEYDEIESIEVNYN